MKKILIAEDEPAIGRTLLRKLKSAGYEVDHVLDGNAALEAMKNATYDLVLLDLVMPELDGFAVLEALQKQGNAIPVIVSSNLGQPDDVERAKQLGAKDYFVKSDTPLVEVVKKVKEMLG